MQVSRQRLQDGHHVRARRGPGRAHPMNMIPLVLLCVLALHGTACGGSTDQPAAVTAGAVATDQTSPASTPPPAGQDKKASPQSPQASPSPTSKTPGDRGAVIARVNGTPIYKTDYDSALESFMQNNQLGQDAPDDQKEQAKKVVLDGLIGSELLFQKAKSIPIDVPQTDVDQAITQTKTGMGEDGFKGELAKRGMTEKDLEGLVRQNLMVQKLIKEQILDTITVSDTEVKSFYDEHQKDLEKPEDVEASHILVRSNTSDPAEKKAAARKKIDEALKRVKAGEDFA